MIMLMICVTNSVHAPSIVVVISQMWGLLLWDFIIWEHAGIQAKNVTTRQGIRMGVYIW